MGIYGVKWIIMTQCWAVYMNSLAFFSRIYKASEVVTLWYDRMMMCLIVKTITIVFLILSLTWVIMHQLVYMDMFGRLSPSLSRPSDSKSESPTL